MKTSFFCAAVLLACPAWAVDRAAVADAINLAKEARELGGETEGSCRRRIQGPLEELVRAVKHVRDDPDATSIRRARNRAGRVAEGLEECPDEVRRPERRLLERLVARLKDVRDDDDDARDDDGE
jgi:hypothetical protein